MDNTKFTRITAEVSGREKIIYEVPWQDVSVNDLCQAFRTIMVGMTFTDGTVGETIASYLMEYYGDKFNIIYLKEK